MPTPRELIGYGIGALGVIFGAWAAFEAQGRVGALSALSAGCASLAATVVAAAACGDVVRSSRAPVMLIVNSVGGGTAGTSPLNSDVVTNRTSPAPCSPATPCPTIFNDPGTASLTVIMKDVTVVAPSSNNRVTITRVHVEYRRADGRNTPGVDVPFPFDGAATATIAAGATGSVAFELVRHDAKLESPLVQLNFNLEVINVIADVTFYGHDQVGNELSASGNIFIAFANHGG